MLVSLLTHMYASFGLNELITQSRYHDDVIKWKHFPRYWPFVRGIHRSPVNSPHKGQWCGALMFSLICASINGWVNNREAGDLRRYHTHYDVTVMIGPYLLLTLVFSNCSARCLYHSSSSFLATSRHSALRFSDSTSEIQFKYEWVCD